MALKVGRIPYLSCEPFYFEMKRRGMAFVRHGTQCAGWSGDSG